VAAGVIVDYSPSMLANTGSAHESFDIDKGKQ
jgi:hypothetical protein